MDLPFGLPTLEASSYHRQVVSLQVGRKLAHYEILEPIGKGGMGEVYRARDGKLGRDVAIKVLPDAFSQNEERLARFKREAMVLASLNHPNIGAIYGLEEADSLWFLVLELVPGETLAERLRRGPIPFAEALELAGQIADALAAAHDNGVIHRDLKPANIKITPDGQIKVLDFGLAKALADEPADGQLSDSPTLSAHATKVGVILGTAAYMSPEQARGKTVDKRTDIFSFGAVLYEMLTGRQLFKGEDAADTMASVIRSDPDFRSLPAEIPPRVREILGRCLEKDPKKRRRDIGDIRTELVAPQEPVAAETQERPWLPIAGAVITLSLATGIAGWHLKPDAPRPLKRFEMVLPEGDFFSGTTHRIVAMSPQATHLVYVANDQFYLRALDQIEAVPIRGTENGREPFFSLDGEWIGFHANGYLKKVAITGGTPVPLCEADTTSGASWATDGTIVFGQASGGIWEVPADGGEPRVLVEGGNGALYRSPQKLPNGNALLLTFNEGLTNWDESTIVVDRLNTGERKTLIRGGSDAHYLPTGHLVYAVESTLFAVPFDLDKLEVTGGSVPVVEGVMRRTTTGIAQFSFSKDGTLAFTSEIGRSDRPLLWMERSGQASRLTDKTGIFSQPRLSPDAKRLAVTVAERDGTDVWLLDIERDTFTQLTSDHASRYPAWSPDGEWLVVSSGSSGNADLVRIRSNFSSPPELVLERDGDELNTRWTPNGKSLVFQRGSSSTADIWVLDLEGDAEPRLFLQTPANEAQPDLSPDGRYIVYHSTVSGDTSQIFVQPFTGSGARRQISTDGGLNPRWSLTGREIFYLDRERQAIMAVEVRTEPELEYGAPQLLFEWPLGNGHPRDWDVSPDGQRFVVLGNLDSKDQPRPRINFVLNWFEEVKRLVPTN